MCLAVVAAILQGEGDQPRQAQEPSFQAGGEEVILDVVGP